MRLTEFCKIMNISKATAFNILKEKDGRKKLGGTWYVTKRGQKLLEQMSPPKRSPYLSCANRWLTEDNDMDSSMPTKSLDGGSQTIIKDALDTIRTKLLDIQRLSRNVPELETEIAGILKGDDISDIILEIDTYIEYMKQ